MKPSTTMLSAALLLALGSVTAEAYVIPGPDHDNNFTMLDPFNGLVGGTNDVAASWDGLYESSANSINFSHMSLSSLTPFFGLNWTTHHIRIFGPGTYTIDTTCTVAQLETGVSVCNNPFSPSQTQQYYTFTVGADQIGGHMLFDWINFTNIDIVEVWSKNVMFGPSSMFTGPGGYNPPYTAWGLMSTDWDGNGINGGAMIDGPLINYSANFNLFSVSAVPVPGAVWLFGSGVVGLIAFARKRVTR